MHTGPTCISVLYIFQITDHILRPGAVMSSDEENVPVPPGSLLIDEETNCFMLEIEDEEELTKVANFSWTLHKPVENFVSESKYVDLAKKYCRIKKNLIL